MPDDCPILRELDAWFCLALDVLAGNAAVRRDVLLLVGGAGRAEDVAAVTAADCEAAAGHLLVFPPGAPGRSLPLTPAFVEVTGLTADSWPDRRDDVAAAARAVEDGIAAVDGALFRLTGLTRPTGVDRVRALRMHAWRHELGTHVDVLVRSYGDELSRLLFAAGDCPATRGDRDVSSLVPLPRQAAARTAVPA